jgi:hypothetical protein
MKAEETHFLGHQTELAKNIVAQSGVQRES